MTRSVIARSLALSASQTKRGRQHLHLVQVQVSDPLFVRRLLRREERPPRNDGRIIHEIYSPSLLLSCSFYQY